MSERTPPSAHDPRDDFDDHFTAQRPLRARELAQRQVRWPAYGMIATGSIGILGVMFLACGLVVGTIDDPESDEWLWTMTLLAVWFLTLLALIFGLCIWAGRNLLNLRRYRLVLYMAYFVTSLSLAGFSAFPFYLFGIWALIVLYQPAVKQEFSAPMGPPS